MTKNKKTSFLYRNSLSIVFLVFFFGALLAQAYFGWKEHNQEIAEFGAPPLGLYAYLKSGHFISATFENFQSEFLQMAMYVILTVFLRQIGSAESKGIDTEEDVDREPMPGPHAPAPVNKGGWRLALYKHSLSIAFIILFILSWLGHLYGSFKDYNVEQQLKHEQVLAISEFLKEPIFWFETFQNWQSEFLSVASIVILTIFLRQKGSPESKPVDTPHLENG
ncbi:DUF6766 family protein [Olivibacter domesticus]|uniref:Transmembrane protein n=1 Tax=Olivibacter domesticus TaxID=407022 RepID=A0A1H7KGW1_OLID1|nr:DUF6766 family protein [Olivibacter domesticus]SEK85740.1 hypothetical protein SAMN05661044_01340 [Olivibacter domesticus]